MIQLLNKTIKRVVILFCAATLLFSSVFMFGSCQSSEPKVTVKISFNDKTYSISYRLYRKFFPSTVQHFLELSDAGFYDGLCFHDYQSGFGMFSGAYTYNETASGDEDTRGLEAREYFSWLEENEVELTQTVYKYVDEGTVPTEGTNTLVGEFSANNYTIENNDKKYGAKKEGALVMYYTDKSEAKLTNVTVKRGAQRAETDDIQGDARWYDTRSYAKNSATSLFYVSFEAESSVNKNYTVFGELYNEDAEDEYDELMDAIEAYIDSYEVDVDTTFTEMTSELPVDTGDWYYKGYNLTATYEVPVKPIVIESIKINRW